MSETRMFARSLCSDLVQVEWKDAEGATHALPAVLEDISVRGACLQVESPVPVDVDVHVRKGSRWGAACRTRYCEYREIGYFIGLAFVESAAWNSQTFNPRHLLDLSDLIVELNARTAH